MSSNCMIAISYVVIAIVLFLIILKYKDTIQDLRLKIAQKDIRIEALTHDVDFWRDKSLINDCEEKVNTELVAKYEQIIDKFIDQRKSDTDSVFMFEGKLYRPVDFTLSRTPNELDTLSVEFVGMYIPHEKGESE